MKFVNWGATRWVFLIGRYAFKVPRPTDHWTIFVRGMLCNAQEKNFTTIKSPSICPVVFSLPFGLMNVMPRCDEVPPNLFSELELGGQVHDLIVKYPPEENPDFRDAVVSDTADNILPVELKRDSFGLLQGRLVAVDYGS